MSPVKIGVLISGGGTNLQAIIDNTKNKNINGEIRLIVSNKEYAYGLTRGELAGIENLYLDPKSFDFDKDYDLKLIEEFKSRDVELIVLAGYLKVLSPEFIKEFKDKIINIHPSLIPQFSGKGYYGDRVHKAVLSSGVKTTGATVHFVDEGTDTGPIILQEKVDVNSTDDLDSLKKKVLNLEHKLLVQAIKLYCEDRIKVEGRLVITN